MRSCNPTTRPRATARTVAICLALALVAGCPTAPPAPPAIEGIFNNTTDPTNRSASYVGAAACRACHPAFGETHELHGHSQALKPVTGPAPHYPAGEGVPQPPPGFDWAGVSYVLGGSSRKAQFIDTDGFLLTTGSTGTATQWNLAFAATGAPAGFVDYLADTPGSAPFEHSCFQCHVTGGIPQDPAEPEFQDNRQGILGTWSEPGVQCEACHGPASRHIGNPQARDLYVNTTASGCAQCHVRDSVDAIAARDGFIESYQAVAELRASGGHASFSCGVCHDPHASVRNDRDSAIRNACTACHVDANMALHTGKVFSRPADGYTEALTCESCHMPLAASLATAFAGVTAGRTGDIRTHIFRIATDGEDFQSMFTPDGSQVAKDQQGRAAVTVDFVCLRCHDGRGNAGELSLGLAGNVAEGIHEADDVIQGSR